MTTISISPSVNGNTPTDLHPPQNTKSMENVENGEIGTNEEEWLDNSYPLSLEERKDLIKLKIEDVRKAIIKLEQRYAFSSFLFSFSQFLIFFLML